MDIEFIEIIGYVKNDTLIDGKALLFSIINENESTECVMFIHPTIYPFITIENESLFNKDEVLKIILNKYSLEELRKL